MPLRPIPESIKETEPPEGAAKAGMYVPGKEYSAFPLTAADAEHALRGGLSEAGFVPVRAKLREEAAELGCSYEALAICLAAVVPAAHMQIALGLIDGGMPPERCFVDEDGEPAVFMGGDPEEEAGFKLIPFDKEAARQGMARAQMAAASAAMNAASRPKPTLH